MTSFRSARDFGAEEIARFLEAVDRHLGAPAKVVILGGGAAALAYGVTSATTDIDTFNAMTAPLREAISKAVADTGLEIAVGQASVATVPTCCEERLERQLVHLTNLEVYVLDKHDLVLSKAVRCVEHDLQQIREIRDRVGLSFDVLVERFRDEMVLGDPARLRAEFLAMIDDVFGELKRAEAEKRLSGKR